MAKIDTLAEQTAFLLEKQREISTAFAQGFEKLYSLLATEQEKAEKEKAGKELEHFQTVDRLIKEQEEGIGAQGKEDIEFLQEQLAAIKQVQDMSDEKQAEELAGMMLEDDSKLAETAQFKVDVEQEAREAMADFQAMIDDITAVLLEDGIEQLATHLEAHKLAAEQEEANEDDEQEEDTQGCQSSACDSCSGCGTDLFQGLEEDNEKE